MNIKQKLLLKWHRFLLEQKHRMDNVLDEMSTSLPPNYPGYPLLLTEYHFDYEPDQQAIYIKRIMRDRLAKLQFEVERTVKHNNGKLTYDQIHELEYIKKTLKQCDEVLKYTKA